MQTPDLDSPVWRIAAATGEEPEAVELALEQMGLLGYTFEDIWTLMRGALDAGVSASGLAAQLGPKAGSASGDSELGDT